MNVQAAEMTIPWKQAHDSFYAYRELVKETPAKATKDDVALYRALKAIVAGKKVLDINLAIRNGGLDEQGLPKLAVGVASWSSVHCWAHDGKYVFSRRERPWQWESKERQYRGEVRVRFPENARHDIRGKAQTPMIPAQFRPKGSLAGYSILWEAEWQRVPPGDPLLLRHLDGPFYVVLAAWDLSPLEQAVLRQKL